MKTLLVALSVALLLTVWHCDRQGARIRELELEATRARATLARRDAALAAAERGARAQAELGEACLERERQAQNEADTRAAIVRRYARTYPPGTRREQGGKTDEQQMGNAARQTVVDRLNRPL